MQETLDNSNAIHNEKDGKIATLEQQLESLSQINEDMSSNSKTVAEQMVELRNALDDRNQSISRLEINLSELAEERELLKKEMANQTQDLLNQMKDLRSQLQEVHVCMSLVEYYEYLYNKLVVLYFFVNCSSPCLFLYCTYMLKTRQLSSECTA